jgi:hypothetical protein
LLNPERGVEAPEFPGKICRALRIRDNASGAVPASENADAMRRLKVAAVLMSRDDSAESTAGVHLDSPRKALCGLRLRRRIDPI